MDQGWIQAQTPMNRGDRPPQDLSPMSAILAGLRVKVDDLHKEIEMLGARLEPIMLPDAKTVEERGGGSKSGSSKMVEAIDMECSHLDEITAVVRVLILRLTV